MVTYCCSSKNEPLNVTSLNTSAIAIQTHLSCYITSAIHPLALFTTDDDHYTMRIRKCGRHKFPRRVLPFWSLWANFASCCPLDLLPNWICSIIMTSYFIHYHISHVEIIFISLQRFQSIVVFAHKWSNAALTHFEQSTG